MHCYPGADGEKTTQGDYKGKVFPAADNVLYWESSWDDLHILRWDIGGRDRIAVVGTVLCQFAI